MTPVHYLFETDYQPSGEFRRKREEQIRNIRRVREYNNRSDEWFGDPRYAKSIKSIGKELRS